MHPTCVEIKFYGAFDACSTAWRCRFLTLGTAASSPRNDLVKMHPTHRLFPHSSQPRVGARECLEI